MSELVRPAEVVSDHLRLSAWVGRPVSAGRPTKAGLVLSHGFPARSPTAAPDRTYSFLAGRIAEALGWTVLALNFRGCGDSEGSFSLQGWCRDLRAAVTHLLEEEAVDGVWLAGSATGGSVALAAAGNDERVRGVVTLAARADFDDWASHPRRILDDARSLGIVEPNEPRDPDAWARELRSTQPLDGARRLGNRELFVLHGDADRRVPIEHARRIADAHGAAMLRVLPHATHRLRLDPRAIALLMGWLDEQAASLTRRTA